MSFSKLSVRFIQKAKGFSSYDFLIFLMQNCYIFQTELKLNIELPVKPKGRRRQTEAANIVTDFVHKTKPLRAKPISKHGNLSKTAQGCSQAALHSPPTEQINTPPPPKKSLSPLKLPLPCKHPLWYKNSFFMGTKGRSFCFHREKEQDRRGTAGRGVRSEEAGA